MKARCFKKRIKLEILASVVNNEIYTYTDKIKLTVQ